MEAVILNQKEKREKKEEFVYLAGRYVRFCKNCSEIFRTNFPHGKKCPDCKRKKKEKSQVRHYFQGVF